MRNVFSIFASAAVLLFAILQASATIDASLQMQLGNPSGAIVDTNNHDHYLIQRTVEAIDYSDNLGEPNWASWDLTTNDVGDSGRSTSFTTDASLPTNFYHVTPGDYDGVGNVGFARGHMCPSDDRTDNTNDNKLVFLMSNIIPQDGINNSGVWGTFEGYCRTLAQSNELLIICGPSGFSGARINTNGPVLIPDYVWKIAVVVPLGTGSALSRITNSTRVIALKIPNTDAATNAWPFYVTSASQIEVDTQPMFLRRIGTGSPGYCQQTVGCPDIWELADGDFAVIGTDITVAATPKLPPSAGCGPDERIVRLPRNLLINAKRDIPERV